MADAGADTEVEPPPDVLEVGPTPINTRRILIIVVVLALVAAGSIAIWRLWPRPPEVMTADELAGVYAGMVRSDGTNDAQKLTPAPNQDTSTVDPEQCRPLVALSHSGLTASAVDGMATYWIQPDPTSMTTHRFPDRRGTQQLLDTLSAALTACSATGVRVNASEFGRNSRFTQVVIADVPADTRQLSYVWTTRGSNGFNRPTTAQFIIRVIGFENTVTVIYRYDFSGQPYDSLREDRVSTSLLTQMRAVLALRTT